MNWKEYLEEAIGNIEKARDDESISDELYSKLRSITNELQYMIDEGK